MYLLDRKIDDDIWTTNNGGGYSSFVMMLLPWRLRTKNRKFSHFETTNKQELKNTSESWPYNDDKILRKKWQCNLFFPQNKHAIVVTCQHNVLWFIFCLFPARLSFNHQIKFERILFAGVVYKWNNRIKFPQIVVKSGMRLKVDTDSNTCSDFFIFLRNLYQVTYSMNDYF